MAVEVLATVVRRLPALPAELDVFDRESMFIEASRSEKRFAPDQAAGAKECRRFGARALVKIRTALAPVPSPRRGSAPLSGGDFHHQPLQESCSSRR
jgi:hypothetical protein